MAELCSVRSVFLMFIIIIMKVTWTYYITTLRIYSVKHAMLAIKLDAALSNFIVHHVCISGT